MTIAGRQLLVQGLEEHIRVVKQLELALELLSVAATRMCHTLQSGHMVFWCGNGGSAADCSAISKARDIGVYTFAMTGKGGGHLTTLADICLQVPSSDPTRIQESHILMGHLLCDLIEAQIDGAGMSDSN